MKAIQFFAITALGAALFASCSNQEKLATGSYPSDNLIRVTAGVNKGQGSLRCIGSERT